MAEVSELHDEEILQFIERNEAANTVRNLGSCFSHSYWYHI
jgi:hypothetical protein